MFNSAQFSERLRQERRARGLNQADFGALGGVGLQTQSRYEKAETEPGASYLANLAANEIDVIYLLVGRRSGTLLNKQASELVSIFAEMPEDMRAGLLDFARSMKRYIGRHGLDETGRGAGISSTLHEKSGDFTGEPSE